MTKEVNEFMAKTTDLLQNGERLEPLEFEVTKEFNENYLHAVEDFHPRYQRGTSSTRSLVHVGLLINYSNLTRSPSFQLPKNVSAIHSHEEIDFIGLARVEDILAVHWIVKDRYERRGPIEAVQTVLHDQGRREWSRSCHSKENRRSTRRRDAGQKRARRRNSIRRHPTVELADT